MSKYILFVLGPTGAGKSKLPAEVINKLNYPPNYVYILIDDLVESNPYYIKKVQDFINTKRESKRLSDEEIIELFLDPPSSMYDYFDKAYKKGRKDTNCDSGKTRNESNGKPIITCDEKNDNNIQTAIQNGANIVIESTGTYFPEWFFELYNEQIISNNYQIIMAWSALDICNLIIRNKTRAKQTVRNFLMDKSQSPPRLPDLRIQEYKRLLRLIIKIFEDTIKKYKTNYCSLRPNCRPIKILLYDNTTNLQLIYNSDNNAMTNNNAIDKIKNLFDVEKECEELSGGFRKYRKKTRSKKYSKNKKTIKRK